VEPLTRGLPPPDSCSLCPLSSTEFVEPPEKNSWYNQETILILRRWFQTRPNVLSGMVTGFHGNECSCFHHAATNFDKLKFAGHAVGVYSAATWSTKKNLIGVTGTPARWLDVACVYLVYEYSTISVCVLD
jgi:hypothetical protein